MADTYEQNLSQKGTLTVNDYIRVVGSDNASYKQLVSDVAKKIIENYTGSSLAGSSQSVKSALDALNSKSVVINHNSVTVNDGYCRIPYPDGFDRLDNVLVQPIYVSGGIQGWSSVLQLAVNDIIVYIRQGTTTPANGSVVSFKAFFIKA